VFEMESQWKLFCLRRSGHNPQDFRYQKPFKGCEGVQRAHQGSKSYPKHLFHNQLKLNQITSISWHPVYESILASSAERIKLWDINCPERLSDLQQKSEYTSQVNSIKWNVEGNLLGSIDTGGNISIHNFFH
jgi:WD40 repeat protein